MLTSNYVLEQFRRGPVIVPKVDYENKSLIEIENLLCGARGKKKTTQDVANCLPSGEERRKNLFQQWLDRLDWIAFGFGNLILLTFVVYAITSHSRLLHLTSPLADDSRSDKGFNLRLWQIRRFFARACVLSIRWNSIFWSFFDLETRRCFAGAKNRFVTFDSNMSFDDHTRTDWISLPSWFIASRL